LEISYDFKRSSFLITTCDSVGSFFVESSCLFTGFINTKFNLRLNDKDEFYLILIFLLFNLLITNLLFVTILQFLISIKFSKFLYDFVDIKIFHTPFRIKTLSVNSLRMKNKITYRLGAWV